ncbi:MAG: radical SAM protein [Candidatus Omnitrophota bacterium]
MNINDELKQNMPYRLLRLGMACNVSCLFCNVPQELYTDKMRSLKEVCRDIDALFYREPCLRLDISGGEPTMHEHLVDVVKYASEKGIDVIQLQTNAVLLSDNSLVLRLKRAGLKSLFVSLHSCIAEHHDVLLGAKGGFKKSIKGIKNALRAGLEVVLNPVVTRYNYQELPDYMVFVKKKLKGINFISLSVVQPRGRAFGNRSLVPCYRVVDPFVRKALNIASQSGLRVSNPYCGLPLCIGGWRYYLDHCVEYSENVLKRSSHAASQPLNTDKIKAKQCLGCILNDFCNGVWKEYAQLYSLSDLKPVKRILKKSFI